MQWLRQWLRQKGWQTRRDAEQRATWFNRGFQSGKLSDCDTFNNPI
jgi:predicted metalloprotease